MDNAVAYGGGAGEVSLDEPADFFAFTVSIALCDCVLGRRMRS
jgi:hypothetical protein